MPDNTDPESDEEPSSRELALKVALAIVSELLSPVTELSQRATPVSPFLHAPLVPVHPVTVMLVFVSVGTIVSSV